MSAIKNPTLERLIITSHFKCAKFKRITKNKKKELKKHLVDYKELLKKTFKIVRYIKGELLHPKKSLEISYQTAHTQVTGEPDDYYSSGRKKKQRQPNLLRSTAMGRDPLYKGLQKHSVELIKNAWPVPHIYPGLFIHKRARVSIPDAIIIHFETPIFHLFAVPSEDIYNCVVKKPYYSKDYKFNNKAKLEMEENKQFISLADIGFFKANTYLTKYSDVIDTEPYHKYNISRKNAFDHFIKSRNAKNSTTNFIRNEQHEFVWIINYPGNFNEYFRASQDLICMLIMCCGMNKVKKRKGIKRLLSLLVIANTLSPRELIYPCIFPNSHQEILPTVPNEELKCIPVLVPKPVIKENIAHFKSRPLKRESLTDEQLTMLVHLKKMRNNESPYTKSFTKTERIYDCAIIDLENLIAGKTKIEAITAPIEHWFILNLFLLSWTKFKETPSRIEWRADYSSKYTNPKLKHAIIDFVNRVLSRNRFYGCGVYERRSSKPHDLVMPSMVDDYNRFPDEQSYFNILQTFPLIIADTPAKVQGGRFGRNFFEVHGYLL